MIDRMKRNGLRVLGAGLLAGCAQVRPQGRSLTIYSLNYTDRYLADVVVDGAWTGGSNAYSNGGGALGLMSPADPNRRAVLKVKWDVGSIYDVESGIYMRATRTQKAADVPVAWPYPPNPSYLILHFYPDGHVEAELSEDKPRRRIPQPPGFKGGGFQ